MKALLTSQFELEDKPVYRSPMAEGFAAGFKDRDYDPVPAQAPAVASPPAINSVARAQQAWAVWARSRESVAVAILSGMIATGCAAPPPAPAMAFCAAERNGRCAEWVFGPTPKQVKAFDRRVFGSGS